MEDSTNVVEINTRLILHSNGDGGVENRQSDDMKDDISSSFEIGQKQLEVAYNHSAGNSKIDKNEKGALVKMCQEHPLILFGLSVILSIANLIIILLCLTGIPDMPSIPDIKSSFALPKLEMPKMQLPGLDFRLNEISIDPCKVVAISLPLTFLLLPLVFNKAIVAYEKARYGKEEENKKNDKLTEFVCKHPMMVFWTGYCMTFLNTVILAICYCGVPEIAMTNISLPSLPKIKLSIPKMDMVKFGYRAVDLNIGACITVTITAMAILLLIVPFMILSPVSPLYAKMKSQRVMLSKIAKSRKKESEDVKSEQTSKIVQYVAEYPQMCFWIGYSLACLNVILLIVCFCEA